MSKKISSGGIFSYPTYDNRTAYSLNQVLKLTNEGFWVDEDVGIFIFNAVMGSVDEAPQS